jgi:iron complex transport system ATP-binding protein
LDSCATDLSLGTQQLLTLAYSLLRQENRLVLLDEPTSHLDFKSQQKVLKSMYDQAISRRATVLMIAHRLETAITFSD